MTDLRAHASYLAVILVAVLTLQACSPGDDPPPSDLPVGNCPEIFASGFRNPWRWSFDGQTGDLWVGDVGQNAREEIDRVVLGGNYGWRCFEGTLATGLPCGSEPNLLPPVAAYEHNGMSRSVTGGYVYRGNAVADLPGRYVFGDFITGQIWNIPSGTPPTLMVSSGFDSGLNISSFGEGADGELYVVQYTGGLLYQLTGVAAALNVQQVFTSLPNFASPVAMLQAPNDDTRWFVVEQGGRVLVFDNDPGAGAIETFVDIAARVASGGEMGLLGMAFHPAFATNGRVYLHYTNATAGRVSRISEFTSVDGGLTLDPSSERILLVIGQPEANHNGGHLAFGPDGYLYIGMGDGGGGNDQHGAIGNGQLMTTLLGKMLRIDVNGASPYAIPSDNPFAGNKPCGTSS
jgi:glucose/arabinose dehydrogenase